MPMHASMPNSLFCRAILSLYLVFDMKYCHKIQLAVRFVYPIITLCIYSNITDTGWYGAAKYSKQCNWPGRNQFYSHSFNRQPCECIESCWIPARQMEATSARTKTSHLRSPHDAQLTSIHVCTYREQLVFACVCVRTQLCMCDVWLCLWFHVDAWFSGCFVAH